ncbi:AMP-binding protein [Gordonia amarae]|uniref:AMP-binding protein n=2 Tax=Gordonia amarae TaxID=36821 RepID=A0A857KNS1_9ACTN|nr:acyl-CoA synthetase [Gordonia amarae]MCS3880725.1 acyl-CoA synthetase (AMP-forming)/AMP-acid ligase II [Gordonia amarae]QHN19018.1 AMP-binding protein [Gordonia amarae]QHN23493.1 AMP-binding protein [Gordonia amarae]QHN32393.1 AMP-binding protein [Gordonia amarae]QHN41141.1 AMP-binding protein [Gordonia amarae]
MSQPSTAPEFAFPEILDAVADAIGDRDLVIFGDRRYTQREIADRSRRLATYLHSRGLGVHTDRAELTGDQAGQDLVGLYAYNGNEYVESMHAAFRARVAPFNVNYRYVKNELEYLLNDAAPTALIYHATFAPTLAEVLPRVPSLRVLIQIADDSGNALLDGAVDYEQVIAGTEPDLADVQPSPDDLYIVYTGGTTGMPKGVLWRQNDIFMGACGGRNVYTGEAVTTLAEIAERAGGGGALKVFVVPPLIHAAAQWAALTASTSGQTLVFSDVPERLDPAAIAATIEKEQPTVLMVVGDAIARPLLTEFEKGRHDVSSIKIFANGGAVLSPQLKERALAVFDSAIVMDGTGSSETGAQMTHVSTAGAVSTGTFNAGSNTTVVTEDLTAETAPGDGHIGWLAQRGHVPLGYKGDPAKTAKTFPVVAGTRYALPGDRAERLADNTIRLLGRDSQTINSGGEKIFAEEVELALASHPSVADVLVTARPSERWGNEVVAIVETLDGAEVSEDDLVEHAATTIARYKLPKAILFRPQIQRSPVGKADYRWAREQATLSLD